MTSTPDEITRLLIAWSQGDQRARDELTPLINMNKLSSNASECLRWIRIFIGSATGCRYFFARIYARIDERDRTLEWLRKAYDRHSDYLVVLKVEPIFDSLRSDPRFTGLLRNIGLAPAN